MDDAEALIDHAIDLAVGSDVVEVSVADFGITRAEWDAFLRPKYLAAGWGEAEWAEMRSGPVVRLAKSRGEES